jgi:hypothetical protein
LTSLCNRTVKRYLKAAGFDTRKARPVPAGPIDPTDPRVATTQTFLDSLANPRDAVTHAVAMEALCKARDPQLIANMDTTQFRCEFDVHSSNVLALTKTNDVGSSSSSSFFINCLSIYFAGGLVAPPVLIVASENISPDEFEVVKINGLSHTCEPGAYGYLAFTASGTANKALFKWVFMNILFPNIEKSRSQCHQGNGHDAADAVFTFNGEHPLSAATDPGESRRTMTHMLKLSTSRTLIQKWGDNEYDVRQASLTANISRALNSISHLNSKMINKVATASAKVVGVLKKNCTISNVDDGAMRMSLKGLPDTWDTMVRPQSFTDSTYVFSAAEINNINAHWDDLMAEFLAHGFLSDVFMDSLSMPRPLQDNFLVNGEVESDRGMRCLNYLSVVATRSDRAKHPEILSDVHEVSTQN